VALKERAVGRKFWCAGRIKASAYTGDARPESEIAEPEAKKIVVFAVKVVALDYHIVGYLTLHTDAKTERMRRLKGAVNCSRRCRRWNYGIIQHAELAPLKIPCGPADGRCCLHQILRRRQASQRLHIADINRRIRWNRGMSGSNDVIEPVNADHRPPKWTCCSGGRDLGIGQAIRNTRSWKADSEG
jgi:hypothetical protein